MICKHLISILNRIYFASLEQSWTTTVNKDAKEQTLVFPIFPKSRTFLEMDRELHLISWTQGDPMWTLGIGRVDNIIVFSKTLHHRPVVPGCAGYAMAHPGFGRSVNPISTRGDRLCPPNYYWHTRIFRPSDGPVIKIYLLESQKKFTRNFKRQCSSSSLLLTCISTSGK